ncbi:MAG: hypothetical protein DUD39_12960 [Coriobacteriaceae bacterium]|nr:MAG: hypothetical protein DUD39_12960 [Coriobacteriaceae bacterium]
MIVAASALYGGTVELLFLLGRLGVEVCFAKSSAPDDFAAALEEAAPRAKVAYVETIGNPRLDIADIEGIACVAHGHAVPLHQWLLRRYWRHAHGLRALHLGLRALACPGEVQPLWQARYPPEPQKRCQPCARCCNGATDGLLYADRRRDARSAHGPHLQQCAQACSPSR